MTSSSSSFFLFNYIRVVTYKGSRRIWLVSRSITVCCGFWNAFIWWRDSTDCGGTLSLLYIRSDDDDDATQGDDINATTVTVSYGRDNWRQLNSELASTWRPGFYELLEDSQQPVARDNSEQHVDATPHLTLAKAFYWKHRQLTGRRYLLLTSLFKSNGKFLPTFHSNSRAFI